jgi:HK97 family phage major capsid protein
MNDVALVEKALDKLQAEVGDKIVELDAKVRDLAQKSAPGWGPGDGGTGGARKSLGDAVRTEQFKSLLAGQTRSATATLAMDIKSAISGDTGSPPTADDVMSPASRVPGIVSGAVRRLQVADLIPRVAVTTNQAGVTVESDFVNAAAGQAFEGDGKPESVLEFRLEQKPIVTVATWVKASQQVLADAPVLENYLNTRLAHFLRVRLEHEILNGNASAGQFDGLLRTANHTVFTPLTGETALDSLRRAGEVVELADYVPTSVILHPSDWRAIELQKTEASVDAYTLGHADGARYVQTGMGPRVWNMQVVLSRSIAAGTFLLGDFAASTMLFDRQQPTIEVGFTGSDFTNNLVVIRAEMRAALGVAVPSALVSGSLTI